MTLHPNDIIDQRRDPENLMRHNFKLRYIAYGAAAVYFGTLSWIGHVAAVIEWVAN